MNYANLNSEQNKKSTTLEMLYVGIDNFYCCVHLEKNLDTTYFMEKLNYWPIGYEKKPLRLDNYPYEYLYAYNSINKYDIIHGNNTMSIGIAKEYLLIAFERTIHLYKTYGIEKYIEELFVTMKEGGLSPTGIPIAKSIEEYIGQPIDNSIKKWIGTYLEPLSDDYEEFKKDIDKYYNNEIYSNDIDIFSLE